MRYLLFLMTLLLAVDGFAQQPELYHRVKINTGQSGLMQLAKAGIAVDHGAGKKGIYFITDLSESEIEKVKSTGLTYEIQIEDVSRYYRERNEATAAEKPTGTGGCVECETYATPVNFQLGSMGGFFTYQEMLNILDSMKSRFPNLITAKQPLGATNTIQGRPVYYVKISDNASTSEPEPQALYTALHHAREAESLSQLIFYMWYLLENYNTDAHIKYLVDHTELYFVPCLNPDGYVYNQTNSPGGGGMWRKNRRNNSGGTFGVDLNRNYGGFWGYDNVGSSPNGNDDTYRGTAAFSEPETQLIRDFCNTHQFKIALNAHTFSNLLIYPYGHIPSTQTPDSSVFQHFAHDMAECSGFATGTGDQTVGYVTNGDSDDWMYDEQTTKGKIFSMTPEAGDQDDGFWPVTSRIIPIAKQTMDQNLDAAKLLTAHVEVSSPDKGTIAPGGPSYVHFTLKRTGLSNSNFTITLIPLNGITAAGPKTFNNPVHLQAYTDSIAITPNGSATPNSGGTIGYVLQWENAEGYVERDTIRRQYGTEELIFYSNGNNLDSFINNGWGISTTQFTTATGSITDSPNGNYSNNSTKTITTKGEIDLTGGTSGAYLTFDAKWDIEKGFDYVTLEASENGATYSPLCGLYTHKGNSNQDDVTAVYDGTQSAWVKEWVDLGDYLNKKIKLRFRLKTDPGLEKDGFYFDEFQVRRVKELPVGIDDRQVGALGLYNVPNPCSGSTEIHYRIPAGQGACHLQLTDQLGRVVQQLPVQAGKQSQRIDVSALQSGIYFCRIVSEQGASAVIKIAVRN